MGERRPPRQLQEFFSPSHRFYGINFGVNNCQIGDQTAKLQNWMEHVARALQLAVHSDFSVSRTLPEPTIQDMHVFSALSFPGSKAVVKKKKKKKRLTLNCNFKLCRRPAVSIASSSNFILRCCFSSLHQTLIYSAQPA